MPGSNISETTSKNPNQEHQELKVWSPFSTINFRNLFETTFRRYWTYVARFRFNNSPTGIPGMNGRFFASSAEEESKTTTRKV